MGWVAAALVMTIGLVKTAYGCIRPASLAASGNMEAEPAEAVTISRPPRTISVVGEGSTGIEPDLARAMVGVDSMSETVDEVTMQSAETMANPHSQAVNRIRSTESAIR